MKKNKIMKNKTEVINELKNLININLDMDIICNCILNTYGPIHPAVKESKLISYEINNIIYTAEPINKDINIKINFPYTNFYEMYIEYWFNDNKVTVKDVIIRHTQIYLKNYLKNYLDDELKQLSNKYNVREINPNNIEITTDFANDYEVFSTFLSPNNPDNLEIHIKLQL